MLKFSRNGIPESLIALSILAGACAITRTRTDTDEPGAMGRYPASSASYCLDQSENFKDSAGNSATLCKKLFLEKPYIHLQDDDQTSDSMHVTVYGGIFPGEDNVIYLLDRDGKQYALADAKGKAFNFISAPVLKKLAGFPSYRYIFTIYKVTGKIKGQVAQPGTSTKLPAFTPDSIKPVVIVDGCAIDSFLLGTWEGQVTPRLEKPISLGGPLVTYFDEKSRVPVLIHFDEIKLREPNGIYNWSGNGRLKEEKSYQLNGTILNMTQDYTTAEGKKYPSLASMGDRNPFLGAKDGAVNLSRYSNMHGLPYDDHWVLTYPDGSQNLSTNGMTHRLEFFDPATLIAKSENSADAERNGILMFPHIPYYTTRHRMELTPVSIGQQSGACGK